MMKHSKFVYFLKFWPKNPCYCQHPCEYLIGASQGLLYHLFNISKWVPMEEKQQQKKGAHNKSHVELLPSTQTYPGFSFFIWFFPLSPQALSKKPSSLPVLCAAGLPSTNIKVVLCSTFSSSLTHILLQNTYGQTGFRQVGEAKGAQAPPIFQSTKTSVFLGNCTYKVCVSCSWKVPWDIRI